LGQSLGISVLELASANKSRDLIAPNTLDLIGNLEAVQLASQGRNLIRVNLALNELNITEDSVDCSG